MYIGWVYKPNVTDVAAQPPSTFGWWLVACKSIQGIWEKNFENFLFRIFKTCFQSFLKTFDVLKNFFEFSNFFWSFPRIFILSNGTPHTLPHLYSHYKWTFVRVYFGINIIHKKQRSWNFRAKKAWMSCWVK